MYRNGAIQQAGTRNVKGQVDVGAVGWIHAHAGQGGQRRPGQRRGPSGACGRSKEGDVSGNRWNLARMIGIISNIGTNVSSAAQRRRSSALGGSLSLFVVDFFVFLLETPPTLASLLLGWRFSEFRQDLAGKGAFKSSNKGGEAEPPVYFDACFRHSTARAWALAALSKYCRRRCRTCRCRRSCIVVILHMLHKVGARIGRFKQCMSIGGDVGSDEGSDVGNKVGRVIAVGEHGVRIRAKCPNSAEGGGWVGVVLEPRCGCWCARGFSEVGKSNRPCTFSRSAAIRSASLLCGDGKPPQHAGLVVAGVQQVGAAGVIVVDGVVVAAVVRL